MRGSLFLKIYLTVLGGIAILALAGLTAVLLSGGREDSGWLDQRAVLLAAALSETDMASMQAALDKLGPASGGELSVRDGGGALVARYASSPSTDSRRFDPVSVPLGKGLTLTARFELPAQAPKGNPLLLLTLVTSLTALAAWPVVRHLTGRLERLRRGVEAWGEGDLSLRVPVEGGDEIAAVATSFNSAAEQVEALVASHRSLLANASHELRSPLARLRMGMDLYEADPSQAWREEILLNLGELDELVGEILLSSRLSHAGPSEPFQPLDLLALTAEEAARAGLGVSGAPVEVMGDPRLLSRLVRNLVQNALRHGEPPVEITVHRAAGFAELAVKDHGPGVREGEDERVFEPFYRPGGHGESAGGWGLGLALVRQIAARHGGVVRCQTPLEGGARFVVSLPLAEMA